MALETGTFISDLVATNPTGADDRSTADDHLRLVKSTILASFTNISGAMTASHTELNKLDGCTASTAELNLTDGLTPTTAELNFVNGVTSAIQTQLNARQPLDSDLTAIAALAKTNSNFIVGNGSTWVAESGSTVRASLGLGALAELNSVAAGQIDANAVRMSEFYTTLGSYSTETITTAGNYAALSGYYALTCNSTMEVQVLYNSVWTKIQDIDGTVPILVWMISTHMRVYHSGAGNQLLKYQRLAG